MHVGSLISAPSIFFTLAKNGPGAEIDRSFRSCRKDPISAGHSPRYSITACDIASLVTGDTLLHNATATCGRESVTSPTHDNSEHGSVGCSPERRKRSFIVIVVVLRKEIGWGIVSAHKRISRQIFHSKLPVKTCPCFGYLQVHENISLALSIGVVPFKRNIAILLPF